jgi:hypothetical protein
VLRRTSTGTPVDQRPPELPLRVALNMVNGRPLAMRIASRSVPDAFWLSQKLERSIATWPSE